MKRILTPLLTLGLLNAFVAIPMAASAQEDPGYGHIGPRHIGKEWDHEGSTMHHRHRRHHREVRVREGREHRNRDRDRSRDRI